MTDRAGRDALGVVAKIERDEAATRQKQRSDLYIEARGQVDGHVMTSIPPPYIPDMEAAFRWFVSEVSMAENAPLDWASADIDTITLTWKRKR